MIWDLDSLVLTGYIKFWAKVLGHLHITPTPTGGGFCVDVTACSWVSRALLTFTYYTPQYSVTLLCNFMWSFTLWLNCCGSSTTPLCNNPTYMVMEYLEGKKFHEVTCCTCGILLNAQVMPGLWTDPYPYKCL